MRGPGMALAVQRDPGVLCRPEVGAALSAEAEGAEGTLTGWKALHMPWTQAQGCLVTENVPEFLGAASHIAVSAACAAGCCQRGMVPGGAVDACVTARICG